MCIRDRSSSPCPSPFPDCNCPCIASSDLRPPELAMLPVAPIVLSDTNTKGHVLFDDLGLLQVPHPEMSILPVPPWSTVSLRRHILCACCIT
eukprot:10952099-Prorocentrum_lima.AAC.1